MTRRRARLAGLTLVMTTLVSALVIPSWAGAQSDGLPPDDGAPIEDSGPSRASATAAAETGPPPESPPTDNAFPIAGQSRSTCSDSFGDPRSGGRTHMGVDCFASIGTPLVAVESGWIRYATEAGPPYNCATGEGDGSGNRVSLRGRSGYVYYYGHLDTILVTTDQPVERGQVIGTVGRTGNAACSAPHLHIEVKCGDDGNPFDPYPVLGAWGKTSPPAGWPRTDAMGLGASFSGPARGDVVAVRCGQLIFQRTWQAGNGLSPSWAAVDGAGVTDADAASPGNGWEPQLFVAGLDAAVWHVIHTGSSWSGESLGGSCTSGPTAAFAATNRLDVFCRGTDQAVWLRTWQPASGWLPWFRIGGIATSAPDAASPGPNDPAQIVVRGADNAAWHMFWNGSAWVAESLGGICSSGPTAAFSGPTRLDIFCRGGDLAIWHRAWTLNGWTPGWDRVGGAVISDPEGASPGPGSVAQIFARGLDGNVYQFYWSSQGWVGQSWGLP